MTNHYFTLKYCFESNGIIEDSQGLILPYSFYKGTLKFSDNQSDFGKNQNESLQNIQII